MIEKEMIDKNKRIPFLLRHVDCSNTGIMFLMERIAKYIYILDCSIYTNPTKYLLTLIRNSLE